MTRPTEWRTATITKIHRETSMVRTFTFEFAQAVQHLAGQHYELRLTAEDGYQATRLYSAANPASTGDGRTLELTIALMPQGEVSPYLFNHVETGAQIELRGPLGRYFVWDANVTGPTLLLGGGTGVVPLRAMLLEHHRLASSEPMTLINSVRCFTDIIYRHEFAKLASPMQRVITTITEACPDDWTGRRGRIDASLIRAELARFGTATPTCYVCGSTPFVEAMADLLVAAGVPADRIRAERFGATAPR